MDPVMGELLKWGWQGVVVAVVVLVVKAFGPPVAALLPAWASAHRRREDQLMEALRAATAVMTEIVSVLQSLRAEVREVREDQAELRIDVEHIAQKLDMPRPRTRRPKGEVARG